MRLPLNLGVKQHFPLAPLTAYRIGGSARYYAKPDTSKKILKLLNWAKNNEIPVFILGAGTNLLISDNGFNGLVIHLRGFKEDTMTGCTAPEWRTGAGVLLNTWVKHLAWSGFAGVEALIGIPGTIGGALRMNAGAFSQEISQHLLSVRVISPDLNITHLKPDQIGFGYRCAPGLEGTLILSASFQLEPGDRTVLIRHLQEILALRRNRQPLQYPSCGSVFKRPEGDFAGRLIESAGLKGLTCGRAQIAEQHANFIINRGGATAKDVLNLIKTVQSRVFETFGIKLEREVILIGFTEEELAGT